MIPPVLHPAKALLFRRMLGEAWEELPASLILAHTPPRLLEGTVRIERGEGALSRLIGRLLRLPDAGERRSIMVKMTQEGAGELWERWVQGRRFASRLEVGAGLFNGLLIEHFGVVSIGVELSWRGDRLEFTPRRWTLLGLPMPDALIPGGISFEREINGQFCFDIEISHPLTGLLIHYSGSLTPV